MVSFSGQLKVSEIQDILLLTYRTEYWRIGRLGKEILLPLNYVPFLDAIDMAQTIEIQTPLQNAQYEDSYISFETT